MIILIIAILFTALCVGGYLVQSSPCPVPKEKAQRKLNKTESFLPDLPSTFVMQLVEVVHEYTSQEKKDEGFIFDTATFGVLRDGRFCHACLATAYMMKTNKIPVSQAKEFAEPITKLLIFPWSRSSDQGLIPRRNVEVAIDLFRTGSPTALIRLYPELDFSLLTKLAGNPPWPWRLDDVNWKTELPKIEEFAKKLKEKGF